MNSQQPDFDAYIRTANSNTSLECDKNVVWFISIFVCAFNFLSLALYRCTLTPSPVHFNPRALIAPLVIASIPNAPDSETQIDASFYTAPSFQLDFFEFPSMQPRNRGISLICVEFGWKPSGIRVHGKWQHFPCGWTFSMAFLASHTYDIQMGSSAFVDGAQSGGQSKLFVRWQ